MLIGRIRRALSPDRVKRLPRGIDHRLGCPRESPPPARPIVIMGFVIGSACLTCWLPAWPLVCHDPITRPAHAAEAPTPAHRAHTPQARRAARTYRRTRDVSNLFGGER
ncbi:hypothetical protein HPP92_008375 [Vanilla planifolia]|uniref:Uncharacterized protein n=1 Tax=Vanilla planifolia TaxID=51239 RepID=A0A835V764_VANPL|nr:hypothetical protein HPP92_008375 [Vanilla planifolia]